jgi:predicted Zn finger-like uncharacterized protein
MTQTIHCPSCQRMLRVPDSLLGQSVKCPSCEHTFTAPEDMEAAAPPPPAARRQPVARAEEEEEDRRPARPVTRRREEEEDEDYRRPSRRRRRDDDGDEDYRGRDDKPGKVQAIGIMTLIGGIYGCLHAVGLMCTIYGLCWPGTYYALVMGIMAIVKGSQLLGQRGYEQEPPSGIAIMQIINVINCDFINLALGIVNLVFLGDEEVKDYFRR